MKIKTNLVTGISSIIFSIALMIIIPFQIVDTSTKMIKADFLPKLLAFIIGICGIVLTVQALMKPEKEKIVEINWKKELRVILYIAALAIYIFLFDKIGFLLDSILLANFTLAYMKTRKVSYYIIINIYTIAIFAIFKFALGIPLPTILIH